MEKMMDLSDLLKHEILDLYSAEEQIIEALPAMIEKATNSELKKALQEHLRVTEEQKNRLDKVQELMSRNDTNTEGGEEERQGFFSRFFRGEEKQKCIGTEGLIREGEKMMNEDMSPEAMDAAIIASAQKIEHYEISGYGTARAYARELELEEVSRLLEQTLNEEYEADDRLTRLAVGRLNIEAEQATHSGNGMEKRRPSPTRRKEDEKKMPAKKAAPAKSASKGSNNKQEGKKQSSNKGVASKSASKGSNKGGSKKSAPAKSASKTAKSAKKSSPSKKSAKKSTARK